MGLQSKAGPENTLKCSLEDARWSIFLCTAGKAKNEMAKTEKQEATILPIHVLGTVSPYPMVVTVIWRRESMLEVSVLTSVQPPVSPRPTTEHQRSCRSLSDPPGPPRPSHWGTWSNWRRGGRGTQCRAWWSAPVCGGKPRSPAVSRFLLVCQCATSAGSAGTWCRAQLRRPTPSRHFQQPEQWWRPWQQPGLGRLESWWQKYYRLQTTDLSHRLVSSWTSPCPRLPGTWSSSLHSRSSRGTPLQRIWPEIFPAALSLLVGAVNTFLPSRTRRCPPSQSSRWSWREHWISDRSELRGN